MKIIVVTGGIGSGKSSVCTIMEEYGFPIYQADSRVKSLYVSDADLLHSIEERLQESFRDESGKFSAGRLASRIFSDAQALQEVEALVFPALMRDFDFFCSEVGDKEGFVVFESATVLEKPQFDGFGDLVLLVDAPLEVRKTRACARDAACAAEVVARMQKQPLMNAFSEGSPDARVDYVIHNVGTFEDLRKEVESFINNLNISK